jgi:hypothetical protein
MADPTSAPASPVAPKLPVTQATHTRSWAIAGTTVIGVPGLVELIDYGAQLAHLNPMPSSAVEAAIAGLIVAGANFAMAFLIRGRAGLAAYFQGD